MEITFVNPQNLKSTLLLAKQQKKIKNFKLISRFAQSIDTPYKLPPSRSPSSEQGEFSVKHPADESAC